MSNQATNKLGTLSKLPLELRDLIYHTLIHIANLTILQTSSTIKEEASKILFKSHTCRMNFGYNALTPTFFPPQNLANKLQNIRFNINYRTRGGVSLFEGRFSSYGLWEKCDRKDVEEHMAKFSGSEIPRKLCVISFTVYSSATQSFDPKVLEVVKTLTGFETVVLEVRIQILDGIPHPSSWTRSECVEYEHFAGSFEMARGMLEPTLGPVELVRDGPRGGFPYRQICRPRKYAGRRAVKEDGSVISEGLSSRV